MVRERNRTTDEELAEFEDAMDEQREELLESLAEDLGGEPEDYRVREKPVPDGGDEH